MEFHFSGCQLQHRILPSRNLSGAAPPVGRPHHRVGPTEFPVNCMLDIPHCHSFQFNEIFDHEMCYGGMEDEAEVKPPKEEQPPKTPIFSLKDEKRLREIEKIEDCFILEFDPYASVTAFPFVLEPLFGGHDSDFTNLVELEPGKEVACRDYPHSRHHCAMYPFSSTPDYLHCKMCYCYVCDAPAPCEQWTKQSSYFKHCKATPDIQIWRDLRNAKKRNVDAYFDEIFSEVGLCDEVKTH